MPTNNPRITITLPDDLHTRIDDYRHEHKIKSQTQAVNELVIKGLQSLNITHHDRNVSVYDYPLDALHIAAEYNSLDDHGKKAVRAIIDVELARIAEPEKVYIMLRHYEFPAAAGEPLDVENGYEMEKYPAYNVPHGTDYTLNLNGESMEPDFPNGCTVYVKRTYDIADGDIIIAWMEGDTGTTCKRVAMDNGRIVRLESINPNGPTFSGAELTGMQVYGKVIGIAEQG